MAGYAESFKAEAFQYRVAITPILPDLDPKIKINFRSQQHFNIMPGALSNLPQHRTMAADNDSLLRVALDVHVHVDVKHGRAVVAFAAVEPASVAWWRAFSRPISATIKRSG